METFGKQLSREGPCSGEGTMGIYGTIVATSFHLVLVALVQRTGMGRNSRLVDIGAGIGRPLLQAMVYPGVKRAIGLEFDPVKVDKARAYCAAMWRKSGLLQALGPISVLGPTFKVLSVTQVGLLCYFTHIYTFWEGLSLRAKIALGVLCYLSSSVQGIAVVQKPFGPNEDPATVMEEKYGFGPLELVAELKGIRQAGSGHTYTAYVFRKVAPGGAPRSLPEALNSDTTAEEPAAALAAALDADDVGDGQAPFAALVTETPCPNGGARTASTAGRSVTASPAADSETVIRHPPNGPAVPPSRFRSGDGSRLGALAEALASGLFHPCDREAYQGACSAVGAFHDDDRRAVLDAALGLALAREAKVQEKDSKSREPEYTRDRDALGLALCGGLFRACTHAPKLEVNCLGAIRHADTKAPANTKFTHGNHLYVRYRDGRKIDRLLPVRNLVVLAWVPGADKQLRLDERGVQLRGEGGHRVVHLDGDRANNALSNLELVRTEPPAPAARKVARPSKPRAAPSKVPATRKQEGGGSGQG